MSNRYDWVKSSYSGPDGGQCLEWAPEYAADHDGVPVRDSKRPNGPQIAPSTAAWQTFVDSLKD
ncbi:DUF397 domain-containing protein [Streptomyces sp. NPDC059070]|uniref:DUF397 domain-containing protein n=1 Tax=Streptomyces sp. NPDC059070 TaxID=3346713 RepID=UPI0036B73032